MLGDIDSEDIKEKLRHLYFEDYDELVHLTKHQANTVPGHKLAPQGCSAAQECIRSFRCIEIMDPDLVAIMLPTDSGSKSEKMLARRSEV